MIRRLKTHRESVGVQLYAMQQQLARLQVALEQTHADFNGLGEGRARAELDADSAKGRHAELKEAGEALRKRLVKNDSEFNALQETLRQVNHLFNERAGATARVAAVGGVGEKKKRTLWEPQRREGGAASSDNPLFDGYCDKANDWRK